MTNSANTSNTAIANLLVDLRSVRGIIGRIPQLIALLILCAMLSVVLHKIHADISGIIAQNPDNLAKEIIGHIISNMAR